jgi:twitching motility protein PilI
MSNLDIQTKHDEPGRLTLHEFQARLVQSMRSAMSASQDESRCLGVSVRGVGVLLKLSSVAEVVACPPLMFVPHTVPWLLGVANIRGSAYSVIDFGAFLRLPVAQQSVKDGANGSVGVGVGKEKNQLIVIGSALVEQCALQVDGLHGIEQVKQWIRVPVSEAGWQPPFVVAVYRDDDARPWYEIDLAHLVATQRFVDVDAKPR